MMIDDDDDNIFEHFYVSNVNNNLHILVNFKFNFKFESVILFAKKNKIESFN